MPGVVGRVGTVLGQHNVNIANFSLGRGRQGQEASAVAVVQVDGEISDKVLDSLALHRDHSSRQSDSLRGAATEGSVGVGCELLIAKSKPRWKHFRRGKLDLLVNALSAQAAVCPARAATARRTSARRSA